MEPRSRSRASSMALPMARPGPQSITGDTAASASPNASSCSSTGTSTPAPVATYTNNSTYEATVYILGWYVFSLSISVYNKWMFGPSLDFHFPILITAFHQLCLFALAAAVLYVRPEMRPSMPEDGFTTAAPGKLKTFVLSCRMPLSVYLRSIVPCSVASSGDIGLSNVSLRYISLSLYTMVKTSSLGFVLIFGLFFGLEKFRWSLVAIVVTMLFSVLLMVSKDLSGDAASATTGSANGSAEDTTSDPNSSLGTVLVLGALVMSGLRWSFTQILLKHNEYTANSICTIFFLSPAMCVVLFALGLVFEGWSNFVASPVWEVRGVLSTLVLMVIPGVLAFMMTLCEFKLLSVAQVVTLSIAGIFKELLTILVSALIFGDRLSWVNCVGLVLTFLDIVWYNYYRYRQRQAAVDVPLGRNEYHGLPTEDDGIEMKKL